MLDSLRCKVVRVGAGGSVDSRTVPCDGTGGGGLGDAMYRHKRNENENEMKRGLIQSFEGEKKKVKKEGVGGIEGRSFEEEELIKS